MPSVQKIYHCIMEGTHDKNMKFRDLQRLLDALGFCQKESNGDHSLYNYPEIEELINIQPEKRNHSKAKPYQVRQIREFIRKNDISLGR